MPKLFAGTITGATQDQLDAPNFRVCVENWRDKSDHLGLVVGRDARAPEIAGLEILRTRTPEVYLLDVLQHACNIVGDTYGRMLVVDPLVRYGSKTKGILDVVDVNQLGNAWMTTALAIVIDGPDGGSMIENNGLRWFLSTGNVWTVMAAEMRRLAIDVPFTSPVWGGFVGAMAKDQLQVFKYFDATDLHQVAWYPDVKVAMPSTIGYGPLDFVPPRQTYLVPAVVEA